MQIASFWARGYRSLRDVRIDGLGPLNVFYGPNGGGKTNLLEAIRALFELVRVIMCEEGDPREPSASRADQALREGVIRRRDLCAWDPGRTIVLGAHLLDNAGARRVLRSGPLSFRELTLEVKLEWIFEHRPVLWISQIHSDEMDLGEYWGDDASWHLGDVDLDRNHLRALLVDVLPARAFGLIAADRQPRPELALPPPQGEDLVTWHLHAGRLKSALLAAQLSPNHETRRRLAALRGLLAGEPLCRPSFDLVQDPRTGEIDLRELLPEPNPEGRDISIDLAGLGIAQMYAILAEAMLLGARAVGIEEPEAHLHAPTSGRALRQLLLRLVEEQHLDQLFVATHSNLFDLDPEGYFDVSLKDGCTIVERAELTRIDREHLYEPGPAKHALARLLQYAPGDEAVFRRPDGAPVTAKEMLLLLQEDDDVAVRFLQDIHGAALRMIKVRSRKPPEGDGGPPPLRRVDQPRRCPVEQPLDSTGDGSPRRLRREPDRGGRRCPRSAGGRSG